MNNIKYLKVGLYYCLSILKSIWETFKDIAWGFFIILLIKQFMFNNTDFLLPYQFLEFNKIMSYFLDYYKGFALVIFIFYFIINFRQLDKNKITKEKKDEKI